VIPATFDYELAGSVDEAIQLLGQGGEDAKLIAGGHSLLPLMKLRLARPSLLVDIERLSDLDDVRDSGDAVEIGALARMHRLADDPVLKEHCGLVAYAAGQVGDPQVRHRATIGGSVAHGDPASDLPTVLLTLDAEFVARGPDGDRTIPASEMFTSLFETALQPTEVLTAIRVPKLGGAGWSYQKFHRRAIDWAIVGVAAVIERSNGDGTAGRTRIGLTNMGPTPLRASAVEQLLQEDTQGSPDRFRRSAELAPEGTSPPSDTNASAEYRRELAKVMVRRALEEALAR
jgi:carbon-monoxide dehydrogenase medium subunit